MMEDLDLDELDQAVNKMMDKPHGKKSAKKPEPRQSTPPTVPDRPADTSYTSSTDDTASRPTNVPVSRPMPKVPPRRRMHPGAMDIIQPSTPKHAPSHGPTRTGVSVQPVNTVAPEPVAPPPAPASLPPAATQSVTDEVTDDLLASLRISDDAPEAPKETLLDTPQQKPASKHGDWPDPLDFHDFDAPHSDAPEMPAEPVETPPSLEPDALLGESPAEQTPASPFVTTKVEKRPLGAYADAKPEPQPATEPAPTPATAPVLEKEKPAMVPDESTTKEDMAETAMHSGHHLFKPGQEPEHDMDDLRSMAIPQQYHTAHSEPNDAVHSVFDTKEYHAAPQPMHTARKGNPGLVIAVVVFIVLVIGAAAVGYLMMTGTDLTHLW